MLKLFYFYFLIIFSISYIKSFFASFGRNHYGDVVREGDTLITFIYEKLNTNKDLSKLSLELSPITKDYMEAPFWAFRECNVQ